MENTFTVAHNNDKSKSLQFIPSLIVKNMSTSKINKTNMFHCPNCKRFFSKQRSLKLHLPSCRRMHVAAEDSHYEVNYHPLRSCYYITNNPLSLNNDEYSNSGDNHQNNDYIDDSNFFLIIHPSCLIILMTATSSFTVTKKHNNNRVQLLRNYK